MWIDELTKAIKKLRKKDKNLVLFGAVEHKYRFGSCLSEKEVEILERIYEINLPNDYKEFIIRIGNGGMGPGYGLQRFGDEVLLKNKPKFVKTGKQQLVAEKEGDWQHYKEILVSEEGKEIDWFDISYYESVERLLESKDKVKMPFPLEKSVFYNDIVQDSQWWDKVYPNCGNGLLFLSNYGCAIGAYLVITGSCNGSVWINDVANDFGIVRFDDYPQEIIDLKLIKKTDGSFLDWYFSWLYGQLKEIETLV